MGRLNPIPDYKERPCQLTGAFYFYYKALANFIRIEFL